MTDLYPTKTRRAFLADIDRGRVVITESGFTMRRSEHGYSRRCEAAAREAVDARWARLRGDGCTYELTDAGRAVIEAGAR